MQDSYGAVEVRAGDHREGRRIHPLFWGWVALANLRRPLSKLLKQGTKLERAAGAVKHVALCPARPPVGFMLIIVRDWIKGPSVAVCPG